MKQLATRRASIPNKKFETILTIISGNLHFVIPVLLCILIMLPRLASPQFGLLDDGVTISTIKGIYSGNWSLLLENSVGRFRPIYWLYHFLIFLVAGSQPFWFFLGNLILLILIVLGLILTVRLVGGSKIQAGLSGIFFLGSTILVENAYTLSKPELLQTFFLITLVYLVLFQYKKLLSLPDAKEKRCKTIITDFCVVFLTFSICATKETGLALLPFAILIYLIKKPEFYLKTLGLILFGGFSFFLLRSILVTTGIGSGSYVQSYAINLPTIISTTMRWSTFLLHDYFFLLFIVIVWIILTKVGKQTPFQFPLTCALLWMGLWLVIYLPWMYTSVYYLLPFSLGAAFFSGIMIGWLLQNLSYYRWLLILFVLIWIISPLHALANAKTQLIVDKENANMVAFIATNADRNQRILINYPANHEYIGEIEQHLDLFWGRQDLEIEPFTSKEDLGTTTITDEPWIVSNIVSNPPPISVRLGIYENESTRLLEKITLSKSFGNKTVWESKSECNAVNIDLGRIINIFSTSSQPIVEFYRFQFGWNIAEVSG
ncbi:MAG: hypothetical protein LLG42_10225 [Chloroflexi bacterium]|nr:hypothetical protein [Chloroflexota bacterium]